MADGDPAPFRGVSLVVSDAGEDVRVTGVADPSTGRAWTAGTQSQIASISKQFAAACALVLVHRGLVRLDDPVDRYLGDAGRSPQDVTVLDLLTHTSGMRHWGKEPGYDPSLSLPASERLPLLLAGWHGGSRGTFTYSSPGYLVLAAVLAAAAATPYHDLVRDLIVEPLGLGETTVGAAGDRPAAVGSRHGVHVPQWDLSTVPGTGDVWSTAGDLARFVAAVHTGELLPSAVQPLLHRSPVPVGRRGDADSVVRTASYGLGHFVGTVDGEPAYLHPGDNPGYLALAAWLPRTATAVVILTNDEAVDIKGEVAAALRRAEAPSTM